MFDRAKVLFGSGNDFTDIGNHTATVRAVSAVEFLDKIQVIKLLPVKDDVITPMYFFNAVNRKACELVKSDKYIRNH